MADPWGFLTTPRRTWPLRPVPERLGDWQEVHRPGALLPIAPAQAGRCMDCGIPFCHSACPLGNLIPDWNARVALGDWAAASELLHATNNFPEFTGFLCPAPCESGCVLAINADPVTIKNIELAIVERAWEQGWIRPLPPARLSGFSVAVVGSGPAGLAAAQQLTRAGHQVAVYERDDRPGGLLRYGIPAFKMEKLPLDRRLAQLRAEGTLFRTGVAVGRDIDAGDLRRRHDAVVVAVGATLARELPVPGRELSGIHQAMEYLTQANRVQEGDFPAPAVSAEGRHVAIVGGGDTGADCLGTVLRQRAASVVQLDIKLLPGPDRTEDEPWPTYPRIHRVSPSHEEGRELIASGGIAEGAPKRLRAVPESERDVRVFAAATVRFEGDEQGRVRCLELMEAEPGTRRPVPGTEYEVPADLVLLALGFAGPEPDSGLAEQLGLDLTPSGAFARDAAFAAGPPGVFVAGDAGRGQSLIVWAIAEGRAAASAADRYLTGATTLPAPVSAWDRPLAV
ncbi:glutamate synthase (NADPH/NADH) small chain [Streptacidiphilus sp. MAP12-20]|uniref:glutamate synthase subunit beta n=1 Tax=Streptacidiphilus sp. MAP12-20 TaxID=3156299 RepID=UPI0035178355